MSDGRFMSCPDFFDETLSSVKFADHKSSKGGFERRKLGGSTVLVWKPQAGIDDSTLEELPGDLVFLGMSEEIGNLEKCKTGKVINQSEVFKMQSQRAHMRLIPARWVCARKSATKVRSRIVAKDIAHGPARKEGFSSPTPSQDAFMLLVSLMAIHNLRGCAADIGHAFMRSPLTSKVPIVLKLPLSVSLVNGEPAFLHLSAAFERTPGCITGMVVAPFKPHPSSRIGCRQS